jgi:hypothetical protein
VTALAGGRRRRRGCTRRRRLGRSAAPPLLVLVAALAFAPSAAGTPPAPLDLHVSGGDTWRADRDFSISWAPPPPSTPALTLTHYRLRDLQGGTITAGVKAGAEDGIGSLVVPPVPASYTAEVWFEDATGTQGPAATVQLRFDDRRPAAIAPLDVPEWIGRTGFPLHIRLGRLAVPLPISGIRGYAVTIDADPSGSPCAASDRCSATETTLAGGIGGDELRIAALAEGDAYLHAVAVSGSGMKSASAGHAELRVDLADPVTSLSGVPAGWTNRPVGLVARSVDSRSGMTPSGSAPAPFTAIRIDDGAPATAPGSTVAVAVAGEGIHRIAYYARDVAGNVDDGALANGVADRAPATALVRIDRTRPSIGFANSQNPREPELLRASIEDALSGADPARGWIGIRPAGSRQRFTALPAAPGPAGELRARWDSDAYPAGRYEFQAAGYDVAGNAAATTRRRNGAPMILSNPLKAPARLDASFAGGRLRRSVAYGHRLGVAGRLLTGIRTPLATAPVRIVERFPAGVRPATRVSTATTGADGAYSLQLAPGPSREIVATFAGGPSLSRATSPRLELAVHSGVRLRASSATAEVGGAPLVFSGGVAGEIPAGGLPVQLQFRLPGLRWSEFRTVQANRRGRFRYAYRFSDDDSRGARFRFRAYVTAHEDWPYEPGSSRPVLVRGY